MTEIVIQPANAHKEATQSAENCVDKLLNRKRDATYFYLLSSMTVFMFILIILLIVFLCIGLKGLKTPMYTIQVVDEKTKHVLRPVSNQTALSPRSLAQKYTACGEAYYAVNPEVARTRHRTARIINGYEASAHSQPWLVSLRRVAPDGQVGGHVCGGALITDRHVLTAAHCVDGMSSDQIAAVTGLHNLYDYTPNDVFLLEKMLVHESYPGGAGSSVIRNDIAILKLDRPIERSETVQTICLPQSDDAVVDNSAIVAGWGDFTSSFVGKAPQSLQIAKLAVTSSASVCGASGDWDPESMLCAIGDDASNICFGTFKFSLYIDCIEFIQQQKKNYLFYI
jgi:hypothetical protein